MDLLVQYMAGRGRIERDVVEIYKRQWEKWAKTDIAIEKTV
jgi:hypothetical protein